MAVETKPMQLSEDIGMYVDDLRQRYPGIDEVWALETVLGTNDDVTQLLLFADRRTLDALREEGEAVNAGPELLVRTDRGLVESVSREGLSVDFASLQFSLDGPQNATYTARAGTGEEQTGCRAVRVR